MNYSIEKCDKKIIPEVAVLNQEIFRGMYEEDPYDEEIFQKKLEGKEPFILAARVGGKLVGFSIAFERNNDLYLGYGGKRVISTCRYCN